MKFSEDELDLIYIALSYLTSNLEGVPHAREMVRDAYRLQGKMKAAHEDEQELEDVEDDC